MEFEIHDYIDIAKITRKELFSVSKRKALFSNILGNAVLEEEKGGGRERYHSSDQPTPLLG